MRAEFQPTVILSLTCRSTQVNAFAVKPIPFSANCDIAAAAAASRDRDGGLRMANYHIIAIKSIALKA